ncbi:conserved hypothetical protein [Vibrio chagasii]|nr:conserved hypothetical protein [Vibrio chagasii]
MANFGFNILSAAQSVMGNQEYQLKKWLRRDRNPENGYDIDVFEEPVTRSASVQPLSRDQYKSRGLDFAKVYITIFDVDLVSLLDREKNADQIIYEGWIYSPLPSDDWGASGGWNEIAAVRVKRA